VKYGDKNIKFFHRVATERHRRNAIASIVDSDGTITVDHDGKAQVLYTVYKRKLGITDLHQMKFNLASLFTPTPALSEISVTFSKEEINEAVQKIPIDKTPGPDGFNGCF
jgi:hypothetical protein